MDLKELDDFIGKVNAVARTISTVRDNIRDRPVAFSTNERQTRSGLIDPVLKVLGWDVSQVDLVGSEYRTKSSGIADYALFSGADPIALIEAKSLRSELDVRIVEQLSNYTSNEPTVRFALFTNGDHWRMRETGKSGTVIDIHLSKESPLKSALELTRMWRDVLVDGQSESGHTTVDEDPPQTDDQGWLRLDAVRYKAWDPRPTRIRLPDQTEIPIHTWNKVWISIAEWVSEREPKMTACRFGEAKPRVIKSSDEGFWGSGGYQLSNGLWIEPGVTGNTLLRTARAFLEHFNVEPSSVSIRFD